MANNLRTNTSGIDIQIERIQTRLYKKLNSLNEGIDINGFGRVYLNKYEEGSKIECYTGNNNYEDVLRSDDTRFFFVLNPEISVPDAISADIGLAVMADLSELFGFEDREDEKLREIVCNVLEKSGFKIEAISIGVDYLKRYLKGVFDNTNLDFEDMEPLHVFTVKGKINYTFKDC